MADAQSRRRKAGGEGGSSERWLLTYADLITLLLAFFIILFAMSTTDVKKYENLTGSLAQAFNVGVLGGSSSSSVVDQSQVKPQEATDATPPAASAILSALGPLPAGEQGEGIQSVTMRPDGIAIAISGSVAFESGSAELTPGGKRILTQVADILKSSERDILIEGHTDNLPTGSARYLTNWDLSTARAMRIVRFFTDDQDIEPRRLAGAGYADQRPIARNSSPEGRRTNRRAEIVLLNPQLNLLAHFWEG